ncbi:unnamed protein product [Anisakis simplex]|uniref:Ammonium transporter n=1 Tax=Anisakis simplex TaxID=6269 RepID=A0A0M3JSZ2_ANISI|nr:unnamed protein product [Anisakis simplex]
MQCGLLQCISNKKGFGLLESGSVSAKDEVNIMVKNVVDVVFGGLSYWAIGYGLSYGDAESLRNPFIGFGRFFYDPTRNNEQTHREGWAYASFLFQLSFATTASTIVSGAVAERAKLKSYILLGCLVILVQALPAHWIWDRDGFFFSLGVVDFAGCCAVHMVGGVIGLIATIYLKPRRNRFNVDSIHQMSSPTNALLGTFMLWWGWFGINAGSVWGITDGRWRLGARAAVATIMSSIGGGSTSIVVSFIKTRKLQVNYLIDGLLSSIVSITAMCAVARPWHALIIGSVSSAISISILPILERLKIDDPVGIVPIHLTSSIWGMFAVGIFAEDDQYIRATYGQYGLIYSGSFRLLGIQMLCSLTVIVYSAVFGLVLLVGLDKSPLGLRVTDYEEQIGADVIEHGLAGTNVARYHIEKPLSSKTFATVTKAITKWKLQTKSHSRAMRQQKLQQRIEARKAERHRINTTIVDTQTANQTTQVSNNNRWSHFNNPPKTPSQLSSSKNGQSDTAALALTELRTIAIAEAADGSAKHEDAIALQQCDNGQQQQQSVVSNSTNSAKLPSTSTNPRKSSSDRCVYRLERTSEGVDACCQQDGVPPYFMGQLLAIPIQSNNATVIIKVYKCAYVHASYIKILNINITL